MDDREVSTTYFLPPCCFSWEGLPTEVLSGGPPRVPGRKPGSYAATLGGDPLEYFDYSTKTVEVASP